MSDQPEANESPDEGLSVAGTVKRGLLYLVLLPFSPIIVPLSVWLGVESVTSKVSFLPGVNEEGGTRSAVAVMTNGAVVVVLAFVLIGTVTGGGLGLLGSDGGDSQPGNTTTPTVQPNPTSTPDESDGATTPTGSNRSDLEERYDRHELMLHNHIVSNSSVGTIPTNISTNENVVTLRYHVNMANQSTFTRQHVEIAASYAAVHQKSWQRDDPWNVTMLSVKMLNENSRVVGSFIVEKWWVYDMVKGDSSPNQMATRALATRTVRGQTAENADASLFKEKAEQDLGINVGLVRIQGDTIRMHYRTETSSAAELESEMLEVARLYGEAQDAGWETVALDVVYYEGDSIEGWYRIDSQTAVALYRGNITEEEALQVMRGDHYTAEEMPGS